MISAKILLDSTSPAGTRLVTFECTYPRFIHSEFMTHRMLCLAGDAVLEFDLPADGGGENATRRVYKMTISEFVHKWLHGAKPHLTRWDTTRTYDLKSRLREMRIRQLDEATGAIITSTVVDAVESGSKPVYEVQAGEYRIAGSADHRVMTIEGWKRIGDLQLGDGLVVRTIKKPDNLKADPLRLKKIDGVWRSRWQLEQGARLRQEDPTCRHCHKMRGENVHHIVPVHVAPDRAFDECNVTWLCEECHHAAHRMQDWQTGNQLYAGIATVTGIRYRGIEPTFDLAIAGAFPNFIANGVVVHNSRNAASSRAIPAHKLIERIKNDPALPVYWGKNQSGMQAAEELPNTDDMRRLIDIGPAMTSSLTPLEYVQGRWLEARNMMLRVAEELADLGAVHPDWAGLGLHKQIANRILEPWMSITVITSATHWENFWHLRVHKDAQPEFQVLAKIMKEAYDASQPTHLLAGDWHLPLIRAEDYADARRMAVEDNPNIEGNESCISAIAGEILRKVSTGRCARVSYLTHDGKRDLKKDIELHDKLLSGQITLEPLHMSPFEHPARALHTPTWSGNFCGFHQYRKDIRNEAGPTVFGLEDSKDGTFTNRYVDDSEDNGHKK